MSSLHTDTLPETKLETLRSTPLPSVSVVICAYTEERWSQLLAAVDSARFQRLPPYEILVVIDHNPRLYDRATERLEGVTVLESDGAPGLSGARNTGIQRASGELIAFIDEDATAAPDWLEHLAAHYQDPAVLGVGGAIRPDWQGGRPRWFPREFDWVVGCTYLGMPAASAPVRNLIGCNMSFRREVFASGLAFRPEMGRIGTRPLGCEETELCIRLLQSRPHGRLLYEPSALVDHHVPHARARLAYFIRRCYSEGLSKASVTRLVGPGDGLASERDYTARVLPRAVLGGLRDFLVRGDVGGLQRAAAVLLGLGATVSGYVLGRVRAAFPAQAPARTGHGLSRGRRP